MFHEELVSLPDLRLKEQVDALEDLVALASCHEDVNQEDVVLAMFVELITMRIAFKGLKASPAPRLFGESWIR